MDLVNEFLANTETILEILDKHDDGRHTGSFVPSYESKRLDAILETLLRIEKLLTK